MKTAVVIGGNSGIGKASAIMLAQQGYRVIIHGSNFQKTEQAADEIKKLSGNATVEFVVADVSLISGMKQLADAIKLKTDSINALILSTGTILTTHVLTPDGLEKSFAIQYLSRFATTQLLLNELSKGNAKIVHVGAAVLPGAKIYFDNISLKENFTMFKAMAQEMFANHLFIQEFSKRYATTGMVMNMADVGIANTGITRNMNIVLRLLIKVIGRSPEKACKNFVYLATDEKVNFTGYFLYWPWSSSVKKKINYDSLQAEKLWNASMAMLKPILNV